MKCRDLALRMLIVFSVVGGLGPPPAAVRAGPDQVVFQDNFSNQSVLDSDGVPVLGKGFWATGGLGGTNTGAIREGSGGLTLEAQVGAPGATPQTWINSGIKPEFNFFKRGLTFTVQFAKTPGISGSTARGSGWANYFSLALISSGTTLWWADDGLQLTFTGGGKGPNVVRLVQKVNHPRDSDHVTKLIANVPLWDQINKATGFSLTVEATTYDLKVMVPVGDGPAADGVIDRHDPGYASFHGNLNLPAAQWGRQGDTGLQLCIQRSFGGQDAVGSFTGVALKRLTVTAAP